MMPVALGILYTRTPWWSGIASCAAALAVTGVLMAAGVAAEHSMIRNVLAETVTATVVFAASAIWYNRSARRAEIERLARDLHTPVPDEEYVPDPETLRVYRMLAQVCVLLGGVLAVCLLLPGQTQSVINGVGAAMLFAVSVVLFRISRS